MKKYALCVCLVGLMVSFVFADEEGFRGRIIADGVNIRADATVGAISICRAREGQLVDVIDTAYDWYKITLPEQAPVYVFGKYVERNEDDEWAVNADNVNLRLKPDIGAAILGQVDEGTRVEVVKQADGWYQIKPLAVTTGWIHERFVEKVKDVRAPRADVAAQEKPVPASSVEATVPRPAAKEKPEETHPVIITVQGKLRSKFFTSVASHKLITDEREVYLIRSSTIYLNDYLHEEIKVTGVLTEIPEAADPLIEVTEITREITD